jgi:hypothetical protein
MMLSGNRPSNLIYRDSKVCHGWQIRKLHVSFFNTYQMPSGSNAFSVPNSRQDKVWHINTQGRRYISDLPASSFMMSLLPLFVPHLPEVEAGPDEKCGNSERQTEDEVYLHGSEMGVRIWAVRF